MCVCIYGTVMQLLFFLSGRVCEELAFDVLL